MKKKIAITMGDPGGIGPEVVIKAVASAGVQDVSIPIVIGSLAVMEEAMRLLKPPLTIRTIESPLRLRHRPGVIDLIDVGGHEGVKRGMPSAEGGQASFSFIKKAVELALSKEVDAVCTAPISKESLRLAGLPWPGHTEMLAELTLTKDYAMMLAGGGLRVILATIHTALRDVPVMITKERVLKTILMAGTACRMLNLQNPVIAVAGLNPHAGEAGMFGSEEAGAIAPAVEEARGMGIDARGPYPPDTVFFRALKGEFAMVVCMYHDQGLIPLKLLAFDKGVNVTVGLPIIRTSPDHGTAYDIAWKGLANPSSMIEAIKLASGLRTPRQDSCPYFFLLM
ncbi:MAG: 4-hydroxythreonine-4-phosphate dehydrogenase PdxA [Thermodesulfovibrionales bacterium]|nr:4-hydroxythreonine-4-phosphate dehydrogenase PdxA [Thermodesulfovibrionales bacterium]